MTRNEFDSVVWGMIKLFALVGFSMVALLGLGCFIYVKLFLR